MQTNKLVLYVSHISLIKQHNTASPYYEIAIHSLPYARTLSKCECKLPSNN